MTLALALLLSVFLPGCLLEHKPWPDAEFLQRDAARIPTLALVDATSYNHWDAAIEESLDCTRLGALTIQQRRECYLLYPELLGGALDAAVGMELDARPAAVPLDFGVDYARPVDFGYSDVLSDTDGTLIDAFVTGDAAEAAAMPMEWVTLEGGRFQKGRLGVVSPIILVTVPTFLIARTEVTVAQYRSCVLTGVCSATDICDWGTPNWTALPGPFEDHPINCINWDQAKTFAEWSNARLCTDSEWEYAARGGGYDAWGVDLLYPWGDEAATCDRAVYNGPRCDNGSTATVGSRPAGNTALGLQDMAGNVSEWVEDHRCAHSVSPGDGSANLCGGADRVVRGGDWASRDQSLWSASSGYAHLDTAVPTLGTRLCRTPE